MKNFSRNGKLTQLKYPKTDLETIKKTLTNIPKIAEMFKYFDRQGKNTIKREGT